MATTTKYDTRKALFDYYVYAPLGAGQLFIEKVRELPGKAWTMATDQSKSLVKAYLDLAERGEKIVKGMSKSTYTTRAIQQTKTARSHVKAAAKKVS
jgi:hypothetical protein